MTRATSETQPTSGHQRLRGHPKWCTATATRQPATISEARVSVPKNSRTSESSCTINEAMEKMPTPISRPVSQRSMWRVRAAIATTIDSPR